MVHKFKIQNTAGIWWAAWDREYPTLRAAASAMARVCCWEYAQLGDPYDEGGYRVWNVHPDGYFLWKRGDREHTHPHCYRIVSEGHPGGVDDPAPLDPRYFFEAPKVYP